MIEINTIVGTLHNDTPPMRRGDFALRTSSRGDELFSDFPEVTCNVTSEPCDVAEIVGHT